MMKCTGIGAAVAVWSCLGALAQAAPVLVYDTTATPTSTQLSGYPGSLVETFTATQAGFAVFALGVYDGAKNGISGTLNVGLYDDTAGSVAISPVSFTTGFAYNGTGGSYFDTKALLTPFQLQVNHTYSIEAWGFTTNDPFYHNGANTVGFNSVGGALTNVVGTSPGSAGEAATNINGNSRGGLANALFNNSTPYSSYGGTAGGYPNPCQGASTTCTTDDPILRFNGTDMAGAGTLTVGAYVPSSGSTPLPGALPMFAGGLAVMSLLGWRKKRRSAVA